MSTAQYDLLARISKLNADLDALRDQYADEPQLFDVYSQAFTYELSLLKEQVRAALADVEDTADVWIGLRGEEFGYGAGPMEVVTNFLANFRVAAKHAASALMGVTHTGGRFLKEIEAAVAFDIVATAPGSLRIGLSRSPATRMPDGPVGELFESAAIDAAIREAEEESRLGVEAIQTLILALSAAGDATALGQLRSRLDDHGALRVLYHARSLFPRGITGLEFRGKGVGPARQFLSDTRERLREVGERLVQAERYVGGVGVVRMLDLDRHTLRLDFARLESFPEMDVVNGEYDESFVGPVSGLLNKPVAFSGFLAFDAKGVPQRIRIDSLELLEAAEENRLLA